MDDDHGLSGLIDHLVFADRLLYLYTKHDAGSVFTLLCCTSACRRRRYALPIDLVILPLRSST